MTREQNIEVIRAACIKANPEIMELKFGCLLLVAGYTPAWMYIRPMRAGKSELVSLGNAPRAIGIFTKDKKLEILGRLIRLADVLLALSERKGPDVFYVTPPELDENKPVTFAYGVIAILLRDWPLADDRLEALKDEDLAFLADLLKS